MMDLSKYIEKRDFRHSPEPKSSQTKSKKGLQFVIQRHQSSHLHYDFRLEMDGVLKSWAIPKGPSLNPKDKRLAVMVEDHPYDYLTFEGEIPEGNYGAGKVDIFDAGEYEALNPNNKNNEKELLKELAEGNLKFKLKGNIIKGGFALRRLNNSKRNWLLIKMKDEDARNQFDIERLIPKEMALKYQTP